MKLPIWIVAYLPKARKAKYIKSVWDNKSDEQILASFDDAAQWITVLGQTDTSGVVSSCQERLDLYILPQMKRRNLSPIKD